MADIQMEYRSYTCNMCCEEFCEQCSTEFASDLGCLYFCDGKNHEDNRIPYGDCIHAQMKNIYNGISTKNYEIEEVFDTYSCDNYMLVKIRNKYYECDKVILDGVQIFPELPKEDKNVD